MAGKTENAGSEKPAGNKLKDAGSTEPGSVEPGVLGEFIGYVMKRAYLTIHGDFLASLDHLGLRPGTFSALSIIVDNPDISQSQLARALEIERSGVVLIVDHLEGRELIGRHRVPGDRRAYALRATLAGRRLRDKAATAIREHEARLLGSLSEEEQAQLRGLLMRVI
ncbi:MarR family transcriptional regulator [Breoghania sp.]|uniref:MarR family winged helix-turn-helix transcriptional regulator n=1 Tax=Breoghania sp. TaxID=2065378 RepID=UPI002AA700BD|nr:MarR family transcriptional regulator [Breoghania sp.]